MNHAGKREIREDETWRLWINFTKEKSLCKSISTVKFCRWVKKRILWPKINPIYQKEVLILCIWNPAWCACNRARKFYKRAVLRKIKLIDNFWKSPIDRFKRITRRRFCCNGLTWVKLESLVAKSCENVGEPIVV